ncbi:MAG: hypothetical protein ACOVQM_17365 [Pirellula sp.]|jgi:hypothetical protein
MKRSPLMGSCCHWLAVLVTFVVPFVAGCGSDNLQQPTYPATGKVTVGGKPVAGAMVVFHPVDKAKFKWEELPQAVTNEQGEYSLYTYTSNDGAPAADYTVGIALVPVADEGEDQVKLEKNRIILPARFADPKTSGLTAKVETKATVIQTFDLPSK